MRKVNQELVNVKLETMLSESAAENRLAAVEIAGWQPPGFLEARLRETVIGDPDIKVSNAALEALERQEKQQWVLDLLDEVLQLPNPKKWSRIEAIAALGDPHLLWDKDDPIWAGRSWEGLGLPYKIHLDFLLEKQEKYLKDKARSIDRKRK